MWFRSKAYSFGDGRQPPPLFVCPAIVDTTPRLADKAGSEPCVIKSRDVSATHYITSAVNSQDDGFLVPGLPRKLNQFVL